MRVQYSIQNAKRMEYGKNNTNHTYRYGKNRAGSPDPLTLSETKSPRMQFQRTLVFIRIQHSYTVPSRKSVQKIENSLTKPMRSPFGRTTKNGDSELSDDRSSSRLHCLPGQQPHHSLPSINPKDDEFDAILAKAAPFLSKITFGGVVGYCSGAAAKKIGRALATMLGLAFVAIQGIVYTGYVSVDWEKVQKDAISAVDTTGDGKITADDLKVYWNKLKAFLTNGIPSASGFTVGFFYGLTN